MKGDNAVITGHFNGYVYSIAIKDMEIFDFAREVEFTAPCTALGVLGSNSTTVTLKIVCRDLELLRAEREQGARNEKD